ncbi:hypothetical protein BDZ89DRAFT_1042903 [Hymenopellis radicata]|nr:hypothetical protein BDZ89DRAFT_1042903 [Hymenopellis radicata]
MPGGRPRKQRHPGGRPPIYHSEESRQAARQASRSLWYFKPRVHERVKKQMRERYHNHYKYAEEAEQGEPSALEAARTRFKEYIDSSEPEFLKKTLTIVLKEYTPYESSPLLDRIGEDLQEMEERSQKALHELLNSVGAWAAEYLEAQGFLDEIKGQQHARATAQGRFHHLFASLKARDGPKDRTTNTDARRRSFVPETTYSDNLRVQDQRLWRTACLHITRHDGETFSQASLTVEPAEYSTLLLFDFSLPTLYLNQSVATHWWLLEPPRALGAASWLNVA